MSDEAVPGTAGGTVEAAGQPDPASTSASGSTTRSRARLALMRNALPVGFVVLIVVFVALGAPNFFTIGNFSQMLRLSAPVMVVAIPMAFLLIMGYVDLSVGSMVALTAVVLGLAITELGPARAAGRPGGAARGRGGRPHQRAARGARRPGAGHRDPRLVRGGARTGHVAGAEPGLRLRRRLLVHRLHGLLRRPLARHRVGRRGPHRRLRPGHLAHRSSRAGHRRERGGHVPVRRQRAGHDPRRLRRHGPGGGPRRRSCGRCC